MARNYRTGIWCGLFVGLAGCGDNMHAVQRDYYNVKHEILDNLMNVRDEDSAKRFNTMCTTRLKEKENTNRERFEKIRNNQFTQKDREALDLELKRLDEIVLRPQKTSAQLRLFQSVSRIRRIIVKIAEEQVAVNKQLNQSFSISASKNWPNLVNLDVISDFSNLGETGFANVMPAMPMMMQGGGPGGPPQPAAQDVPEKLNPNLFKVYNYVVECRRTEDPAQPWAESRGWRLGGTVVGNLEYKGIDLVPLTGGQ